MTDQPVFVLGEGLHALEPVAFETEAEFQKLLARHPRVLDFGLLEDGQPLRLVLVAREMGVPTSDVSGPAFWLDHLFVDGDGVPTLVEVKRATDTRIRREVVGQMLDYAANGARYWPSAVLRRSFEDTCRADGRSLEEAYGDLLGERTPEEFWETVQERLAAGRMRLLFAADRIPVELRAIVEFLNRQMRHTDVYALELTQYRGGSDLRVLVPRIHGEVATAARTSSRPGGAQRCTRAAMDEAARSRFAPDIQRVVTALLDHASTNGRLVGGTAGYPSMSAYYPVAGKQVPTWSLSLHADPAKGGTLSFSFGSVVYHLGPDPTAAFAAALPAVAALDRQLAALSGKGYNGWPSVSLGALASEAAALGGVLAAIDDLMAKGMAP